MNSTEKTAALLCCLGQPPYIHGVTELGDKIGCSKSGTYKLLTALIGSGLAARGADRKYTLGPMVYLLGETYKKNIGISRVIQPFITRLRDQTDENVSFTMLIGGVPTLVFREESLQMVRVAGRVGQERPFHAGATGKILGAYQTEEEIRNRLMNEPLQAYTANTITSPERLLEEYETIRNQGYAISSEELSEGLFGVGAPIFDQAGKVFAAISIGAPRMRVDKAKEERFIYLIRETAKDITEALQGKGTKNEEEEL